MLALYIVAGIILFIVFVLSIPVELAFELAVREETKSRARVGWLFGLVWKDIGREKKKPRKKPRKKKKRSMKPFLDLLRTEAVRSGLLKLIRKILRCFKVRQLDADLRIGLDEPADTGMLCALLYPVLATFSLPSPVRVRFEPSFSEPALEIDLRGWVRLFPIQMVGSLLQFALSQAGWRTIKSMAVSGWKSKR